MFTPTKKVMDFLDRPIHSVLALFLCINRFCPIGSVFKIGYMTRDNSYFLQKLKKDLQNIGNSFLYIGLFLLICGFYDDFFSEKSIYYLLIFLCFFLLFNLVLLSQICSGLVLFVIYYVYHVGMSLGDMFLFWGIICFLSSGKRCHFAIFISAIGSYLSVQESVLYSSYFQALFISLCCFEIVLVIYEIKNRVIPCVQSECVKDIMASFGKKIDDDDILPKISRINHYKYYHGLFFILNIAFLFGVACLMYQDAKSVWNVKDFYFPEWGVFTLQFVFVCLYGLLFPDLSVHERVLFLIFFVVFMTFLPNMAMMVLILGAFICYLINAYTTFFLLLKCIAIDLILIFLNYGINFRQGALFIFILMGICYFLAWRKHHD